MVRPVPEAELDLVIAALLCGLALNEDVMARLAARGHPALRFSHGFVFQHLVDGPLPIGALARRMRVTQQAASKAVRELEGLGYVERTPDPGDGRVRRVGLSARGEAAVLATRAARAELAAELAQRLGADRAERLRTDLLATLEAGGGLAAVRARRVPPLR
jgi:DNA-binding MarR family transcriptional regulator